MLLTPPGVALSYPSSSSSLVAVVLLVLSVVLLLLVLLARIDTARALRQRAGGAYTLVRAVCKMGEPPLVPVFVFAIVSVPLSAVCAYAFQSIVPPLDGADFAMQVLVGVFAFAGQWLMSQSLKMERAGRATSITYVKVLGTYALGVGILGEEPTLLGAG
eukprot:CAMPEP_0182906940 /NCGR_PEP_ID=MMETSP0034_2-20130328/34128_1 /TAXON_ID=156128 /ORGANISM="Nephroselmis pyriformis, Strain CCMP717" /LENGTH=159 /DNA_ID=CAMNT_0025042759 /DNA_START=63 /DNA_END=538 /DNA_ORIENTATION=-